MAEFGTFPTSPYYLHSEKAKGRDLKYSLQSQTGGRDRWEIIPIEDFELTDISYAFVAGDKINLNPQLIRTENLVNNTNSSVSKKMVVNETVSETSNFSKVQGLNISNKISASIKVGLPKIVDGIINADQTTTKNWSYTVGQSTTTTRQIQDEFNLTIPPYNTYKVECFIYNYDVDITYVATLRGKSSGRTIKMTGRWTGKEATHIDFKVYEAKSNNLISVSTRELLITE